MAIPGQVECCYPDRVNAQSQGPDAHFQTQLSSSDHSVPTLRRTAPASFRAVAERADNLERSLLGCQSRRLLKKPPPIVRWGKSSEKRPYLLVLSHHYMHRRGQVGELHYSISRDRGFSLVS